MSQAQDTSTPVASEPVAASPDKLTYQDKADSWQSYIDKAKAAHPVNKKNGITSNLAGNPQESKAGAPESDGVASPQQAFLELDISGTKQKISLDEARKRLQVQESADRKFKAAKNLERESQKKIEQITKEYNEILAQLSESPEKVLPKLVKDQSKLKKFAEEVIYDRIIDQTDPTLANQRKLERSLAEAQDRLKQFEERDLTVQQQQEHERKQRESQRFYEDYSKTLNESLEAVGVPSGERWARSMIASYMKAAINKGFTHVEPQDVAPLVKKKYDQYINGLYSSLTPEQLVNRLGVDNAKKVRQYFLKEYDKQPTRPEATINLQKPKKQSDGTPIMSHKEYMDRVMKNFS